MILDTHIWLWHVRGDARLSESLRRRIDADPGRCLLSPVVMWEALILAQKGRFHLSEDPIGFIREAIRETAFLEAPLTHEIVVLSRELPFTHDDPADRFLAATSIAHQAPLITLDDRLRSLQWLSTVSS